MSGGENIMSTVIMLVIGAWITTLSMNLVYSLRECGKLLIRQQMALRLDSSAAEAASSLRGSMGRGVANVG
jgi:hypothetical protein